MELTINEKDYRLYFGTDFVDYINNANGMVVEGVKTNVGGMLMLNAGLSMKSPSTLRLILKGATNTLASKPSNKDLEDYINGLLDQEDDDEYEILFEEIETEIKKLPANRREMGITKNKKA
ncbi:tail assembly chaperone [Jeotgalibaca sp. A127]|uniref:tail assembly chaperone n=1 Tax=Jeotgalibaca sp. A127 TaxID=3457324 RepID=UPI003FD3AFD4